jgi:hypothetical protein
VGAHASLVPLGHPARDNGDRAHCVPAEVVDGGGVEARRVEGHHRDVGLAGRRGAEQVVDVHAPFEHDDAGLLVQDAQRGRLPRRSRGDDEDADHLPVLSCGRRR